MSARRTAGIAAGVAITGLAIAGGYQWLGRSAALAPSASLAVPVARVERGALTLTVHLQGELRAKRQATLTAPPAGGTLRILSVLETGTRVAQDDVIMEFDPADQQYAIEQAASELAEAEQEIIKRRAEIRAQEAQDKVALLTGEFDVRRAELNASVDEDLISANEYQVRKAELEEAKRNLEKLKQDVASRAVTSKASLAVLQERQTRSKMAAARAQQIMDNMALRAPMDGVVSVRDNMDASGGMYYSGMTLPPYRAGDTIYSGRTVIDVFDVSTMEVRARVNEQERTNVAVGQKAAIETDIVPGLQSPAAVSSVSGLGRADSRMGPLRQFDVVLDLKDPDPRLKPGTTVRVLIQGDTVENVLLLPRQALFEVDGKPTVYAREIGAPSFAPRQVKVLHRTESQIAIEGLDEGIEVALVDPVAALRLGGSTAGAGGPMGGKK